MTTFFPPTLLLIVHLLLALIVLPAHAQTVVTEISPKLMGEAKYLKGEASKPALLILHGFTTTRNFPTIESLVSGLNLEGYNVLAPNLTFGISQRQHSIKCQAIHTHTLDQDAKEIQTWVNWLHQHGHKNVILIGHSAGSMQILYALSKHIVKKTDSAILTSLYYFHGAEVGSSEEDTLKAKERLKQAKPTVNTYSFLFCKQNYNATAESYLSYQVVTRKYILNALRHTEIPITIIMGGGDHRYPNVEKNWTSELDATRAHVEIVKNANHFFSGEAEFDLIDRIIEILKKQH